MKVLGIETSCDETGVAIVDGERRILCNLVASQFEDHAPYGGVVPEIAARAHMHHLERLLKAATEQANTPLSQVDAIAVTAGPGLIGGVIVGLMTAKALSSVTGKPLVAVNHLEGHALTARLTNDVPFPFLLLLVSGGHCQILIAEGIGKYTRLGSTLDDAIGEAFDKTAKLLGLGQPGGPAVEKRAKEGNPKRFALPRPLTNREGCDFSFSGLKTAVLHAVEDVKKEKGTLTEQDVNDMCASFQQACADILCNRMKHAIALFKERCPAGLHMVVAGGVAANMHLRGALTELCKKHALEFVAPPLGLCTDNAAMIAWAGLERFKSGITDPLTTAPKARWPLDPTPE